MGVFIADLLFDFLRDFNNDAYEIALQIEDEVTVSPASIKTYATTFLECIVDDMLFKSGNRSNINPMASFTSKVKKLTMFNVIKYSFETQLINAYKLRNTAHYSLKKTPEEDKRIALELYEKLFHIAWRYFKEFGGDEYDYLEKPKYIPPFRENEDNELVEVPDIERMEKIFDKCIICGRKNNSKYHNLCHDCNNKIEHVEDFINLKNNFKNEFSKKNVVDLGYSKPYSDALIRELLNENLILKVDKKYIFNDDYFKDYLHEIELYGEIELILSEFASGKLSLKDIKSSTYYEKGKKGIKPFKQLFEIVNEEVIKEFSSQLNLGIEISDIVDDILISNDEIIDWFYHQLKLLEDGIKNEEFINYNKISIDSYIKLRALGKTKKEIIKHLHLPDDIVEFWQKTYLRELDYFKEKLDDTLMDLILKAINENKIKNQFLNEFDISQTKFNYLLENYDDFKKIYQKQYISKRRKKFLYYLNENDFTSSINKSYLTQREVEDWLKIGEKDFELSHRTQLADFYQKTIETSMKLYVKYMLKGISKSKAAKNINQTTQTIDKWLKRKDHEMFINFQNEYKKTSKNIIINELKKGSDLKQIASQTDITLNSLKSLIKKGENGEKEYVELYKIYLSNYIPQKLDTFLTLIKTSKFTKALKKSGLTEEELNKFYILGLKGDLKFKQFSDEYFEFKVKKYSKDIVKKHKTHSKAARNANLIDEDFKYHQNEIDDMILKDQLKLILPLLKTNMYLKEIADQLDIDINELFEWYIKGYNGDERFKEFSETYWEYHIEEAIDDFQPLFDEGVSESFILNELIDKNLVDEFNFWKKLDIFEFSDKNLTFEQEKEITDEIILSKLKSKLSSSLYDELFR